MTIQKCPELHFKRPQKHFEKKTGELKKDAPIYVLKTPDVDNLITGV